MKEKRLEESESKAGYLGRGMEAKGFSFYLVDGERIEHILS